MEEKGTKYARGKHPNTLASLKEEGYRGGRKCDFNERKKNRSVSMTDKGWELIKITAKEHGYKSISEFLENIARGEIKISA